MNNRETRQQLAVLGAIMFNRGRAVGVPEKDASDFLMMDPELRQKQRRTRMLDMLRSIARPSKGRPKFRRRRQP